MKLPNFTSIMDALQRWTRHLHHTQMMAILFVMAAITVAITTPRGAVAYFVNTYNAPLDFLIAAFALSAVILFSRPTFKWFAVAHLPIVMFAVAGLIYTFAQATTGAAISVYYCLMLVIFPLCVRMPATWRIRIHHVYGTLLMLIGLAIMAYPARGTVAYIETTYGVPAALLGFSLILAAVYLLINATSNALIHVSALLIFYVSCVIVVGWVQHNYIAVAINLNLLLAIFFTVTKAHTYYERQSVPSSRATLPEGAIRTTEGA